MPHKKLFCTKLIGFGSLLVSFIVGFACPLSNAAEPARWTASKMAGSPEPPLPYRIKPAYPKLVFDRPVLIEPVPGTKLLMVGEVAGKLVTFEDRENATEKTVVGDIKVKHADTSALYGLAFHPKFTANRKVYICYVVGGELPEGTRLSEFMMTDSTPPRLRLETERPLLTWKGGGHNGGALAFGPDGKLYVSTGDAGPASPPDPARTGQDVTDLLSSILRIDIDQTSEKLPYAIPQDNPFVGLPNVRPEIWAYGFRNPWKITFDSKSGDLWVGDVGWELWELVQRVERGGNYGWSAMEGRQPVHKGIATGPSPVRPPTIDHPHSEAASITGGYVYHGKEVPKLNGHYVYGDYQSGFVWAAKWDGVKVAKLEKIAESGLRLVSFGLDHSGELLMVEHDRTNQLYRLEANPVVANPNATQKFPAKLSETGLFADLAGMIPHAGVMPYEINSPTWMDGAKSIQHMAIPPKGCLEIDPTGGQWRLPDGSVLAKTVTLNVPGSEKPRRMETQILLRQEGAWSAYSYLWNDQQTDATLVPAEGASVMLDLKDEENGGEKYRSRYRVSARAECVLCHNPWAEAKTTVYGRQSASPLGLNKSQLDHPKPERHKAYQELANWATGTATDVPKADPARTLYASSESDASPERRARSWLHVNCSQCHAFNAGGAATIILEAWAKTSEMNMLKVKPQQGDLGLGASAFLVAPGKPEESVLFARIAKHGPGHMPRLGSREVDPKGAALIASWIEALGQVDQLKTEQPAVVSQNGSTDAVRNHVKAIQGTSKISEDVIQTHVEELVKSPVGALALSRQELVGLSPSTRVQITKVAKNLKSPEVREYLERFLPRSERIERLGDGFSVDEVLTLSGDASRGATLMFAQTGPNCASCHAVNGRGGKVGPALDGIGARYDKSNLIRHLVEPSWAIDPKWLTVTVECHDGRVLSGLKETLSDGSVKIRDAKGETLLKPSEIERMGTGPVSLMPVGLLRDLTAEQASDLLAYLSSLRTPESKETK